MFLDQIYWDYLMELKRARELMFNELLIKRTAGDDDGARSVLDSICRRSIGIPLSALRQTAPERLWELTQTGGQSNFNSILLAELLLKDVEMSEKDGKTSQALVSRLQAFCLFSDSLSILGPEQQAEYRTRIDQLACDLKAMSTEPYVRNKVDSYQSTKIRT